ncbi:MAG: saccharopine dehydrogenase, partial [Deinococcus-Thermus bacterium]|nr:saccharopine dehydrogenase [Deinococcota bacterium]
GRLVAAAVAARAPGGLRWALAGRDRAKLERIRDELGADPDIVVADAHDVDALAQMARRTRAVVTTVGPYARYGTPLQVACAEAGTHAADLTGEPLWMRDTIDLLHDRARATGARLVHACGFDSVPSDLGVLALQEAANRRHGRPCRRIVHAFGPMSGGVSGGTLASGLATLDTVADDPSARRALGDPDLLAPGGAPSDDALGPVWPMRHAHLDDWTAPFAMAHVNAKVVRRSRHLLEEPWGDDVAYLERMRTATWARAAAIGLGGTVGVALLSAKPLRDLARRALPKPGQGPSEAVRERGFFRTTLIGHVDAALPPLIGRVEGRGDPGYAATARMLAETGLLLALDEVPVQGGVLTPAVAGGGRLIERLREVDVRIEVEATQRPSATNAAPA